MCGTSCIRMSVHLIFIVQYNPWNDERIKHHAQLYVSFCDDSNSFLELEFLAIFCSINGKI